MYLHTELSVVNRDSYSTDLGSGALHGGRKSLNALETVGIHCLKSLRFGGQTEIQYLL